MIRIISALALLFFSSPTFAQQVVDVTQVPATLGFTWDANPAVENVTSYDVLLDGVVVGSTADTVLSIPVDTANITHTVQVRAANADGVSGPSAPFSFMLVVSVVEPPPVVQPPTSVTPPIEPVRVRIVAGD